MSRVTRKEWYRRVNAAWPAVVPPLTDDEAIRAGRKLFRFAKGYTFRGDVVVTSGRRYTWVRNGTMYVNPSHGWRDLVHFLSHYCVPGKHGAEHARAELRMIKQVIRRGWLDGRLKTAPKPEPPPPSLNEARVEKMQRIEQRIARWESKRKRAETALKKLRKSRRYYERLVAP